MIDGGKVIKGLECLAQAKEPTANPCKDCGYSDRPNYAICVKDIASDTIDLLKEQEAKNGEWITIWREDDPDTSTHARCSICNRISGRPLGGYCKWCGAKMNQEWGIDG